mgnify:CR=1 FL=1
MGQRLRPFVELLAENAKHQARSGFALPMQRGFLYLVAIIDWASRAVLAWRLSNSLDVSFCLEALDEALARFGTPEIFNTDPFAAFRPRPLCGSDRWSADRKRRVAPTLTGCDWAGRLAS